MLPNDRWVLNVAVARVLGWKDVLPDCYTPCGQRWCGTVPPGEVGIWGTGRAMIPDYCSEMAFAWRIVEHFNRIGWWVRLYQGPEGAVAEIGEKDLIAGEASDYTMPMALCKATVAWAEWNKKYGAA